MENGSSKFKLNYIGEVMEYQEIVVDLLEYYFNGSASFSDFGDGACLLKGKDEWAYIFNKRLHRDDGPARIILHTDSFSGLRCYFIFYKNGKQHNETGPAAIVYSMHGPESIQESYYLNNKWFTKWQWEEQVKTKLYW